MMGTMRRGSTAIRVVVWGLVLVIAALVGYIIVQSGALKDKPRIALVTADEDEYWDAVIEGAQIAADRRKIDLTVRRATGDTAEQTRMIQELIDQGYAAVAVSPVDSEKQAGDLRRFAGQIHLITLDSDSPLSNRLCFVGTDNYTAGRKAGELIKQAIPEGGRVAIAVGSIRKANGRDRRQGVIDELLDRSFDAQRAPDAIDAELVGAKYTIAGTFVDDINPEQAAEILGGALREDPEIDAIVGLYGYSTPAALTALERAGRLGSIPVVGFDYNERTLEGIEKGQVFGTIVQDQFHYGLRSIDILATVADAGADYAPLSQEIHYPTVQVTKGNLQQFRTDFLEKRDPASIAQLIAAGG